MRALEAEFGQLITQFRRVISPRTRTGVSPGMLPGAYKVFTTIGWAFESDHHLIPRGSTDDGQGPDQQDGARAGEPGVGDPDARPDGYGRSSLSLPTPEGLEAPVRGPEPTEERLLQPCSRELGPSPISTG